MAPPLSTTLPYRPPYDWRHLLSHYRAHAVPYLEQVDDVSYTRIIDTSRGLGWFAVRHEEDRQALSVSVWNGDSSDLARAAGSVRRMFDLDVDPAIVGQAMVADQHLNRIWRQHPGLRVARAWSGFESLITTTLGQLVSVGFGRVLIAELMRAAGTRATDPRTDQEIYLFPTGRQILKADLTSVRTSHRRRATLQALAAFALDRRLSSCDPEMDTSFKKALRAVAGVGPWTAEYVMMRGFADTDAFPATDYALKRELRRHAGIDPRLVSPWRAYAAVALWRSFAEHKVDAKALSGDSA